MKKGEHDAKIKTICISSFGTGCYCCLPVADAAKTKYSEVGEGKGREELALDLL
ncbi:MAG: hypothetical protein V8S08_09650 [Lachnoclostridium sp.]